MCPARQTNSLGWRFSNIKFTSYMMNGAVINGIGGYDFASGRVGRTYRGSELKPSDMLFWEPDETQYDYFNDACSKPSEGLTKRHGIGAVLGIMDGHVEFINWNRSLPTGCRSIQEQPMVLPWLFQRPLTGAAVLLLPACAAAIVALGGCGKKAADIRFQSAESEKAFPGLASAVPSLALKLLCGAR